MTPLLEARGLTVRFGPVTVVSGVDLDLAAGTLTGLIGPNGAGKTTVVDALAGLVAASGQVLLEGRAVERLPAHLRARRGLARTFQSLALFEDLTVGENLLVAAEAAGGARAAPVIGAGADVDGDDELPGRRPHPRRSQLAIARALAGRPKVLLLDEPAAGLDAAERAALGRRLRDLAAGGLAVLLVDHDLDLVLDVCDRVMVLDRGRVVAAGAPAEVRAAAGLGRGAELAQLHLVGGSGASTVLEVKGLAAGHAGVEVVAGVDLTVGAGEVVALLGPNGAGRTTLLRAISGDLTRSAGTVRVAAAEVPAGRPHAAARRGLASVPQSRALFSELTVSEHLRLAVGGGRARVAAETARVVELVPALEVLLGRQAGVLSGGEARMVALAVALARRPCVLLVDELSLGLAPAAVEGLVAVLRGAAGQGAGVLVVEQHPAVAQAVADRAYALARGRVVAEGTPAEVAALAAGTNPPGGGPLHRH